MKDLIELKSRYEEHNYLRKLAKPDGSESKTYMLKTSTYTIRGGMTDKKKRFIDPAGGPMIVEGEYLEEAGAVVKSIDYVMGQGYAITFEVTPEEEEEEEEELIDAIVNI